MTVMLVRKFANLIDVSPDGKSPLPVPVRRVLEPPLVYTYTQHLYGVDRLEPTTGLSRPVRYEDRRLYRYDDRGRFVCGVGFLRRVCDLLKDSGYDVVFQDKDPPRRRPRCYETDWDAVLESFTFRPRQEDCLVAIASNSYGVIDAPTGFGKSYLLAMLITLFPNAVFHVVTRRKDVVAKTVRELTKHVASVGQVGGGRRYKGRRVTVFTADSLHLSDGDADFLLVDEAHELMAPSYGPELARYRYSHNYAFTATPEGRADRADAKMESLFGQTIFRLTYQDAVSLGLVAPIVVDWVDVRLPDNPCDGKRDVYKKRWGLWRNEGRNKIIAAKAASYADEQVLVLVETIEHAMHLRKHLPDYSLCYADVSPTDWQTYKNKGLVGPDEETVTPASRDRMRRDFEDGILRKVIATDVWSTGVDFAGLQVLIRADARSSDIMDVQAPGRVCRRYLDKPFGVLVDFLDQFDRGFHGKALKRHRNYKDKGWHQMTPEKSAARGGKRWESPNSTKTTGTTSP